ncbi:hypothetical protein D9V78_00280 [Buchnera aphidicola (Sarucallis kahawaluokalani)]|uniref:Uncharacterized protein n=1 Tax=Buchnera aphidicola (Sarucallis kahawaluokalani) TaxID=1241878 RepID=A0A4D6YJ24_9GAMM|nr:hypothetical protein D9V78_00280 [Buchnera aphidicola (Sarucallis kahawaluokalani)]
MCNCFFLITLLRIFNLKYIKNFDLSINVHKNFHLEILKNNINNVDVMNIKKFFKKYKSL